jgi:glycosyltransferase involved in cell wall biosynthesis
VSDHVKAMRILLINYRYFVSGGPERYMFSLQDLLESHGHEIIPFSIRYAQNRRSKFEEYFVAPLARADEIFFRDQTWTPATAWKTLSRAFYSREVYRHLQTLIRDTRPDCAIVLHYLRKLSPSVLGALQSARVPYIVRLSDFGMVCPNAHLYRGNSVCELCLKGSRISSVRYRCVQGSLAASVVSYAATSVHNAFHLFDSIPLFVVPSQFSLTKMIEGGIPESRLVHIPTMVTPTEDHSHDRLNNQILYSGRIDRLKGVELLLDAMDLLSKEHSDLSWRLAIAGGGDQPYTEMLKVRAREMHGERVKFLGNLAWNDLQVELGRSLCAIAPSLWYDNMPNAVLESLAHQTPVIAPHHGSFPEIIQHNATGLLFKPGSSVDLGRKITWMLQHPSDAKLFGKAGLEFVMSQHSPEAHYQHMMSALSQVGAVGL